MESLFTENISEEARREAFNTFVDRPITAGAIVDLVRFLRDRMVRSDFGDEALDTCGTGGSAKSTMNTSTLVALLLNTLGVKIAKHGNRSASGRCGSFDLLEALGVRIDLSVEEEKAAYEKFGLVFMYARGHHPILASVAGLRRAYGKRTIFNLVGPLCNPARVARHVLGVSDVKTAELLAEACAILGDDCVIVSGLDGLDEVTICEQSLVLRVCAGEVKKELVEPEFFGVVRGDFREIAGGDCAVNREIFERIIRGEGSEAQKDFVAMNGAFGLNLMRPEVELREAFELCREALDDDRCARRLMEYKNFLE